MGFGSPGIHMASFNAMRKLGLLLCFALWANLFHASIMPVQNPSSGHGATIASFTPTPHASHACDDTPTSTSPDQACHLSGHLCCLGLSAATSQIPRTVAVLGPPTLNPGLQKLSLQTHPEAQFKPPRLL
jgi:hypothetical protein